MNNRIPKIIVTGLNKNKIQTRAVIYSRVNKNGDEKTFSHEAQIDSCNRFISKMGWKLIQIYKDTCSDPQERGEDCSVMLEDNKNNWFDVIVCVDLDRLPFNTQYFFQMMNSGSNSSKVIPLNLFKVKKRRIYLSVLSEEDKNLTYASSELYLTYNTKNEDF